MDRRSKYDQRPRQTGPLHRPGSSSYKHCAGGWIGFDFAVRQRPSGLIQMWSNPSGGPVSCRAAQVAVGAQSLSRTIANLGRENRLQSAPEQTRERTEDRLRTARPQTPKHASWLCPTTVLASESWLVLLVRAGGSELVIDSVSLF